MSIQTHVRPSSTSVNGFLLVVLSFALIGSFTVCSVSNVCESLEWLPDRYWLFAIPAYLALIPVFYIIFYVGYNLYSTNNVDSIHTMEDSFTRYHPSRQNPSSKHTRSTDFDPNYSIPDVYDIPLTKVNQILYGSASRSR